MVGWAEGEAPPLTPQWGGGNFDRLSAGLELEPLVEGVVSSSPDAAGLNAIALAFGG